jgi:type IV pilus assembly protein PilC
VTKKTESLTLTNIQTKFSTISQKDKVIFTRELAIMLGAGLQIVQALRTLAEKQLNKRFGQIIMVIAKDVEGGTALGASISQFPNLFSDIFVNLIMAGEEAGRLEEFLKKIAGQMEKDYMMKRKAKGAAIYPAIVLLALIVSWGVVVYFLIPRLKSMLAGAGGGLPITTRILVGMSDFSIKYWYMLVPMIILPFVAGWLFIKNTRQGQSFWNHFIVKVPIIGLIMKKIYTARFTRTLSVLISSGLPILKCVDLTANAIGNMHYKQELIKCLDKVKNGSSLSEALQGSTRFSADILQMLSVGEKTGALEEVTNKVAEYYEEDVENALNNLSKLLEPALIIIVGLGVGIVYYSIMAPIYDTMDAMRGVK